MKIADIRQQREELLAKPRRIIFNNDGCDVLYEMKAGTKEAFLEARSNGLPNTQVDSVFYTPTCSGFGQFTYATDIGDRFTCTAKPNREGEVGNFANNRFGELLEQGLDPVQMETEFCHEHGMECFCSFRMNDVHDGWAAWYSHHLFNPLKRSHRQWLVGEGIPGVPGNNNPFGSWTAVDYGREEVRDLAVAFVDEVCRKFDLDGIELDFCRHYVYFKSQAWGDNASAAEMAMMTDMMHRMRAAVEEHSVRRGRPILLAVRVPDSEGYRRAMGLDLEAWLANDYVDLFAVSDYFRLCPWEANVELARRHGKKVFACLSESRERDKAACRLRNSIESYRARTMQALKAGVDGIYLFNAQDVSDETLFNQLGDPDKLRALPKVYVSTARSVGNADFWMRDGARRFLERSFVCPSHPRTIPADGTVELPLPIGDEATGPEAPTFILKLVSTGDAKLQVRCNGTDLTLKPSQSDAETVAEIDRGVIRNGTNTFAISAPAETHLLDLQLWVFPAGCEQSLEADQSIRESMKERNELLTGKK
ncbi:MAG: hypothetical protein HN904_10065 [Victivallales bacterium]|nr:hypothetical protein [Victivallales bacterium]